MSFESFKLNPRIMAGVVEAGYTTPTPIQVQAIPPVLEGRDVLGLAQTGTGKTAAFVLPILQRLLTGPRGRVRVLVIAPTRELAEQTHVAFSTLGKAVNARSMALYGGVGMRQQIDRLRAGAEIVVACPGRLLDHIGQGNIDLRHLEVLVLDEADRMLDMGFLPDVRKIIRLLPARRQNLMFSATMPDEIRSLANETLKMNKPVTVQIGLAAPAKTVAHALYPVSQGRKTDLLLELLYGTEGDSILVFTRTKHRAKRLAEQLQKAGFSTASLQGNLSQTRRQAALDGFRAGKYRVLVATDLAARGIDVEGISHVINYDMPDTVDAYTHRIGRTGRAAKLGDAFTLVTPEDAEMVRAIERVLGTRIERRTLPNFDPREAPREKPAAQPERARPGPSNRRAPATAAVAAPAAATAAPANRTSWPRRSDRNRRWSAR